MSDFDKHIELVKDWANDTVAETKRKWYAIGLHDKARVLRYIGGGKKEFGKSLTKSLRVKVKEMDGMVDKITFLVNYQEVFHRTGTGKGSKRGSGGNRTPHNVLPATIAGGLERLAKIIAEMRGVALMDELKFSDNIDIQRVKI